MKLKQDLAASFQESVIDTLIKKAFFACRLKNVKQLLVGGGVVANSRLRQKFKTCCDESGIRCFFPNMDLCMDNAAMVIGLAYQLYKQGVRSDLYLNM